MRERFTAIGFCLFAAASPVGSVHAQPAPPQASVPRPVDPRVTAAQAAFEALPETTRMSIQNDLVWVTSFSGAALGTFGRLTYEAISAYQKAINQPVDGVLNDKQRAQLAADAGKARSAMRFAIQSDPVTGSGIGIPATLLTKAEKTPIGSKWTSESGNIVLETVRTAPDKADMPGTFERFVNAAVPGRKVTYKLLRPDFFVVTGEMAPKKFYTRFAPTPEGLRGYTLTYDAALSPGIDKIVIAIANTFEPLKAARPATPATGAQASTPQAPGVAPLALSPVQAAPTERALTALTLGGGKLLTAAKAVEGCKTITLGGKPAQILATDSASGLALLATESAPAASMPAMREAAIAGGDNLVAFGIDAASRKLVVSPGVAVGGEPNPSLPVALQNGSAGSIVLDRQGHLAGLVTDLPPLNVQIAGVLPVRAYRFAPASTVRAFLDQKGVKTQAGGAAGDKTTGELAQIAGKSSISASCGL